MNATKTPGNMVVTLVMSDEEFNHLHELWGNAVGHMPDVNDYRFSPNQETINFYNNIIKITKAIIYGGQEEIVG